MYPNERGIQRGLDAMLTKCRLERKKSCPACGAQVPQSEYERYGGCVECWHNWAALNDEAIDPWRADYELEQAQVSDEFTDAQDWKEESA